MLATVTVLCALLATPVQASRAANTVSSIAGTWNMSLQGGHVTRVF